MANPRPKRRYPLPKRFNAALSEQAYENLRLLNRKYGLSNNYLLTVLLENLETITQPDRLHRIFGEFIEQYGAPPPDGGDG